MHSTRFVVLPFFILLSLDAQSERCASASEASSELVFIVKDFDGKGGPFDCCGDNRNLILPELTIAEPGEFLLSAEITCIEYGEFESGDFIMLSCRIEDGGRIKLFTRQTYFKNATFSSPLEILRKSINLRI